MDLTFGISLLLLVGLPALVLVTQHSAPARRAASALLGLVLLAGMVVGGIAFWRGAELTLNLSSWTPFPFALALDRLSAFFVLLICAVSFPAALFSTSYVESHYQGGKRAWFWTLLPWFVASMITVVTASTAFAFLFGWELMTLFSAGLILLDGDSEQRRHDLFIYLVMMHAGAAAVVATFLLFLPRAPGLALAAMRSAALPPGIRTAAFVLALIGFGAKAGLIPLHLWLPRAHPMAPSPVSALMSGVMLKTAVYGFVRVVFDILGGGPAWWGYLALALGAISGLLGILYALAERDLKRLLAYSSVENIGIIFMGLGASLVFLAHGASQWATLALMGALLHALNHALFKGTLFLGAGAIGHSAHILDLDQLGGLQRRMPATGTAFLIACCSIVGLPLGNAFISEWLIFRSLIAGSGLTTIASTVVLPLMSGVLALIGGIAAACFAKVYGVAFLERPRSASAEHAAEVPAAMRASMSVLALACLVLGVAPGLLFKPLTLAICAMIPAGAMPAEALALAHTLPWIALTVGVLALATLAVRGVVRATATWACGMPGLDSRMLYTSTSFSKPLRRLFSQVYKPDRTVEVSPAREPYFPTAITYRSVRTTSYERALYRPAVDAIVAGAYRLRQLQTGNIQVYLLYIFLALVALLVGMKFL